MRTEIINHSTVDVYFSETCAETFTFKEWEGHGKRRVYVSSGAGKQGQLGYIDMETRQFNKQRSISAIATTAVDAYLAQNI